MNGRCKLCLKDKIDLQNSHFLPAGIYRRLRDDKEANPNPWMITNKKSIQTSWQMTAPLLCRCCEQRLSKNGENWVLANCLQKDGRFPLAAILGSRTPDIASGTTATKIYYASKIPEIDVSALFYFGISIFWRGSIHPWNDDGSSPVMLGLFGEQFRQYLMGENAFPKDCSFWVVVREGKEISRLTYFPIGERKGIYHVYKFPMPGFALSVMVGKNIPANLRAGCFVRGVGNPIIVTPIIEKLLEEEAVKLHKMAASAQPLNRALKSRT